MKFKSHYEYADYLVVKFEAKRMKNKPRQEKISTISSSCCYEMEKIVKYRVVSCKKKPDVKAIVQNICRVWDFGNASKLLLRKPGLAAQQPKVNNR